MSAPTEVTEPTELDFVAVVTGEDLEEWEVSDEDGEEYVFYAKDGPPSWSRLVDFPDRNTEAYKTAYTDAALSGAPKLVIDSEGYEWELVGKFNVNGDTECPFGQGEPVETGDECPWCGETEEHGVVYLDDTWRELVYRMRDEL